MITALRSKCIIFLLFVACSANVNANAQLSGGGSYVISSNGGSVSVNFGSIQNTSNNVTTGTLHLQLWASPDSNPEGNGYALTPNLNLSTFNGGGDGRLAPGESFTNLEFTTSYTPPPRGNYYVYLVLSEFPALNTIISSAPATNNPTILGPVESGVPNDDAAVADAFVEAAAASTTPMGLWVVALLVVQRRLRSNRNV